MKMIIPANNNMGYYKFLDGGDLNRHGGVVSSDSFEAFHAAVKKYLSDSPALSTANEAYTSYLTENKSTTSQIFNRVFQSI